MHEPPMDSSLMYHIYAFLGHMPYPVQGRGFSQLEGEVEILAALVARSY